MAAIEKNKANWIYLLTTLFILVNAFLVYKEQYWGFLIPVALFLLILYVYSLDKILLLVVFLTPLAINLRDPDFNLGVSIPTEPLLAGVLLWFLLRLVHKNDFDKRIFHHPVSIAIMINLAWMLITTLSSELPVVSWKYLLVRIWFVVPLFYVGALLFKNPVNIRRFVWLYTIPLLGVVFYTLYNHAQWNFADQPGHWVMTPFYNDHTAYGAALAMFIPPVLAFGLPGISSKGVRVYAWVVVVILLVALFFSYSRAAWVSLFIALLVFLMVLFKIRFRTVAISVILAFGLLMAFQDQIFMKLEKNKQDSSSNLMEHVQSIANITTDASNLERINRWNSAFRMFRERPLMGWGPGTYQFLYAPFQKSKERTIISTNAGDKGNAHSEYFGPLSESGVLGMLTFLLIAVFSMITGFKVYRDAADRSVRVIALALTLGLTTYYIHGFLNNFLDTDKSSVPFWGFIAVLVALDLFAEKGGRVSERKKEEGELIS